jgi:hypothetical protein
MSIPKISNNLYTKILQNKTVLKGLEKVSEHGTSCTAGISLILSTVVRPLVIKSTPDVEKENKQYAMANSIASGLIKFGIVEAVALPIEYGVKEIDNNPEKFLRKSTIKNLGANNGRSYKLITQIIKLSTGFLTAIPKSMLTLALIPIIMDKMFFKKKSSSSQIQQKITPSFGKNISFNGLNQSLSKGLAHIINNEKVQKLAIKFQNKDNDIAKHITAGTDLLLTGTFAYQTNKSKKIKENRKKALIYNNLIATGLTLGLGYGIDNIIKNRTQKFIQKFKTINKNNPKVLTYVEGINILRPTIIFAGIYYGILPMVSTYFAQKVDTYIQKTNKK